MTFKLLNSYYISFVLLLESGGEVENRLLMNFHLVMCCEKCDDIYVYFCKTY